MEKISVKTEFGRSYLVIRNEITREKEYMLNMILHNKLKGFLLCREYPVENERMLYYEITNMKSIEKEYENRNMSFDEMQYLFQKINEILEYSNSYLLDQEYFVLEPEYIFLNLETDEIFLLYIPEENGRKKYELDKMLRQSRYYKLADFLLEKVNHREEHAVNIAYQFYKMSKEDFFSITSFINYIEKEKIIKNSENSKTQEKLQTSEPDEKENDEEKNNKSTFMQWYFPIGTAVAAVILSILYIYFQKKTIYDLYIILAAMVLGILAMLKMFLNIWKCILQKKEEDYEMKIEPISIEEYWDDSDETVFFDEDKNDLLTDLKLEWKEKGSPKKFIMNHFPITIGKLEAEADCIVRDASISRLHAKLFKKENEIHIQDLNSTNGTSVNGVPLTAGEELMVKRGDELQLGKLAFFIV